ncbi:MAG: glycosyltransferase family 2 protein [Alphaproteobacteria bacterium]
MKISVVCPFYNEEAIIEAAIEGMAAKLATLEHDWELIVVNDGSLDQSFSMAKRTSAGNVRIKVTGYEKNRGRGYALRYGINQAEGDIVVTTEVDLSWGDDIVHRLAEAFQKHPGADMIVASPNLPGGGYKNVPLKRVLISRLGNKIIRMGQGREMSMYTGMTRGYKREAFLSLPIDEDEKEFHLEVAQKAQAFGFKIHEIPCVLEWKDAKLARPGSAKRKSSSKIPKLIRTHMAFAAAAAPFRYILPLSLVMLGLSVPFGIWAMVNLLTGQPSALVLITGLMLFLIGFVAFAIGMLSYQNQLIQRDLWRIRRDLIR